MSNHNRRELQFGALRQIQNSNISRYLAGANYNKIPDYKLLGGRYESHYECVLRYLIVLAASIHSQFVLACSTNTFICHTTFV